MTTQQIEQLEALGFEWEIKLGLRKDSWQDRVKELLEFRETHGHCRVPFGYRENPELAKWVFNVRQNYRLRKGMRRVVLTQERMDELEKYGFEWETNIMKWGDRLEELREFASKYGHVSVPKLWPDNPQLGRWLSTQRTQYRYFKRGKPSKLNDEQVAQLEAVGLAWSDDKIDGPVKTNAMWERRFQELKEYQEKHNTIGVPKTECSNLCAWYGKQRKQYQLYKMGKSSSLTRDQVCRLESLNIGKSRGEHKWDTMFEQLREFRDENGHCRVPQIFPPNQKLGSWVNTIRYQYHMQAQENGDPHPRRPSDEKIKQLRELGFDFSRKSRRRKETAVSCTGTGI